MILYTVGDSVSWGAELKNKEDERYSSLISKSIGAIDCNNATAGVSNSFIFRNTIRDVFQWNKTNRIWDETNGWIESDKLKVIIGWTAPTRFEWWNGNKYLQDRLWVDYDKWGDVDEWQNTDIQDQFILHQTENIPSYIRTFNYIHSVKSILESLNIDYYFFNTFYHYEKIQQPKEKIDTWGREEDQLGFEYLYYHMDNMYDYLHQKNGTFLPRRHPSKESHQIWADYILTNNLL